MFWTARKFRQANQYEEATNIYTQIIQRYPTDAFANKAVVELSNCVIQQLIEKGKDTEAIAAIEKLFTDYHNNPQVLSVALRIAELYQVKSREFDKQNNTTESQASLARSAAILDLIIKNAPNATDTAERCSLAGDCYYGAGNYAKSVECFQKAANDYPNYDGRWKALFMIGRNYEAMKQVQVPSREADGRIRDAYEELLAKYPDSQVRQICA